MVDWTLKLREAWQKSRRIKKACRIGRQSCGRHVEVQKEQETVVDWTLKLREACGSPKGARNRGGLDVEAAGKQAEVQKEQESVTDWTLKLRGSRLRSKRSKKA